MFGKKPPHDRVKNCNILLIRNSKPTLPHIFLNRRVYNSKKTKEFIFCLLWRANQVLIFIGDNHITLY